MALVDLVGEEGVLRVGPVEHGVEALGVGDVEHLVVLVVDELARLEEAARQDPAAERRGDAGEEVLDDAERGERPA